jgi:signal transduction histidine kinase
MENKHFKRLTSADKIDLCTQWKEEHKERKRLATIQKYSLDKWNIDDEGLQSISKIASRICNTPFSFISLVQNKNITFLSRFGTNIKSTVRENSFCDLAIEQEDFFEVENSYNDPRFKEHEFVKNQLKPLIYFGGCPIKSPEGNPIGTLYVADYLERKMNDTQKKALLLLSEEVMLHLDLKQKYHELKIANEKILILTNDKQNFMNNVSHDLRTPLNAIKGYTDILSKTNLNEDQITPVKIIKSSCEFLTFLINDILEFSKIQEGKVNLEKIEFNLGETLFELKDLLLHKAKEKNLIFDLLIDDKIPDFLMGDKMRIYQILMNLAANAIKFTDKGFIIIKAKLLTETNKNIKVYFSVKDSGIGIPEDQLENIFERFTQAETDTFRKYGGTGLGLSISKDLVKLHNSNLKVKSKIGKGSKFYFDIIFEKSSNKKIKSKLINSKNFKKNKQKNYKFLICEDNYLNVKMIESLFNDKDILIDFAENGEICINILQQKKMRIIMILF